MNKLKTIGKKQIFHYIKKNGKKFELNNKSIACNVLYVPYNNEKIRHAYTSKYHKEPENQVILLMITDGKKWHHLPVKKLSARLRRVASKHDGDFYCLNCFHSYTTKNKPEKDYSVLKNHAYCYVEMPTEDSKTLKYNHSMKVPFLIYADLESLREKKSTCHSSKRQGAQFCQAKKPVVSRNAGDEKNLHHGSCKFFLINFMDVFSFSSLVFFCFF